MLRSYKIKSELSEKQVEADMATYFGWICPESQALPIRLCDVNEITTGADKRIDYIIPMYLQFKTSQGLKPLSSSFNLPSLQNTPLQRIRKFRLFHEMADNPILYFKLRNKSNHAEEFQHNVLLAINSIQDTFGFYVAPLSLTLSEHEKLLFDRGKRPIPQFYFDGANIIYQKNWISYLGMIPFFRGHISITPHERVSNSDHYYSFNKTACEIGWHSPKKIEFSSRFSDTVKNIFSLAISIKYIWKNPNEYINDLKKLDLEVPIPKDIFSEDPIIALQNFGDYIYRKYEIKQYLFCIDYENFDRIFNHND